MLFKTGVEWRTDIYNLDMMTLGRRQGYMVGTQRSVNVFYARFACIA